RRNDGRFPASEKYLTSVRVVLDGKGKIIDVLIRDSSGISELDEAAIESFNKAGPFPNPPKGMLRNDRAAIEWGFAVTNS
ncbi:MAG: energy transducer TonB, partial [Bdellovibrionota bacterium]|nr:energy transducer TonB [Bdellovibrionota bacterium]